MNVKNISFQLKVDDFLPATDEEKQSLVQMRPSISFWKDALRRLRKTMWQ
jgi:oligopeptide transport system permease protein